VLARETHALPEDSKAAFTEFRELVTGAGAEIVAEVLQRRPRPDPATLVGKGKVEEIAAVAESSQATLILFDHDLTPTQLRNLNVRCRCGWWTGRS
jgi:GTPase